MRYKAVFHLDLENDQLFNLGLGNITNTLAALEGKEKDLILLVNGPGITMLTREKAAPYLEQIQKLLEAGVHFQACNNAMNKFNVDSTELTAGVEIIPAGIIGLIDLQNSGYAYIKP